MESTAIDIGIPQLVFGYLLLIIPVFLFLFYRVRLMKEFMISLLRMTLQLLFVGLYLQVVFDLNRWWLNVLWLLVMLTAADLSLLSGSKLVARRYLFPVFISLLVGTGIPLIFFLGGILRIPNLLDARYFIPIAGMIMGNSLRADIVGLRTFYSSLRSGRKTYHFSLAQGANRREAVRPFLKQAYTASLAPTLATMATVGLVSLPGMMTGIILGGTNPAVAIKYQIAIMIAIFSGTAVSVILGILLTIRVSFNPYGVLDESIFTEPED